jgi:hypothetical protein
MKHLNSTTRLFVGILILTLLLTYVALGLSRYQKNFVPDYGVIHKETKVADPDSKPAQELLDTSDWTEYSEETFGISFAHPKDWSVTVDELSNKFYDIEILSKDKAKNLHVFVSKTGFMALDDASKKPYKLGNLEGAQVNENLIGIKAGEYYYTFDASLNGGAIEEFPTFMETVDFK